MLGTSARTPASLLGMNPHAPNGPSNAPLRLGLEPTSTPGSGVKRRGRVALAVLRGVLGALGALGLAGLAAGQGALSADRAFGSHMVLQRRQPIQVWGLASPGAEVEVVLSEERAVTIAGADGRWRAQLGPMEAGGPHSLTLRSEAHEVTLEDVLVGEVWVCAGQSNMRWTLGQSAAAEAALAASSIPELRLLDFVGEAYPSSRAWTEEELAKCSPERYYRTSGWAVSSPASARPFSAVAWTFGRDLQARLGVPVGLIHNAIGGTCTEAYISPERLRAEPELADGEGWLKDPRAPEWPRQRGRENLARWFAAPQGPMPGHPFQPGFLHEAAIAPLAGLGLAGAIWYQGESNATLADMQVAADPARCRTSLTALIDDWRDTFARPGLPFLMVQLPGMGRAWMEYREVQRQVAKLPGVGLAVTLDLGHPTDVHPRRKREVGARLAGLALHGVYDQYLPRSPAARSAALEGSDCILRISRAEGGLRTRDGEEVRGVEVQGEDGEWSPTSAVVRGSDLVVSSPEKVTPRAVRYAWAPVPDGNLVGSTGLPLGPFVEPVQRGLSADR